jgi:hypothetical protein
MTVRSQLLALNAVLSEIYGAPTRIGGVLTALGFDEQQTNTLRKVHLQALLSTVIVMFEERLSARDKEDRLYTILRRRFGLDGAPSETFQSIGSRLGISRERVRQLQRKTIRLLRSKSALRFLEEGVVQTAIQLVGPPANRATADASPRRSSVNKPAPSSARTGRNVPDKWNSLEKATNAYLENHPEIRRLYPRAYEPWSNLEDLSLASWIQSGGDVPSIASYLRRRPSAINSRLKKLGLDPNLSKPRKSEDVSDICTDRISMSPSIEFPVDYPLPWERHRSERNRRMPWWIDQPRED